MRAPTFTLPATAVLDFFEHLRPHRISVVLRLPPAPAEFECRFHRGLARAHARGYRIGGELRFDLVGIRLQPALRAAIFACGGSECDFGTFVDGWYLAEPANPTSNLPAA